MRRRLDVSRRVASATWFVVTLCGVLGSLPASRVCAAGSKVVLGPTAVSGFSTADGELAREALAEALRMQGMRVTPLAPSAGEGVAARASASHGCDLACGTRLLATAGADMSAWVKLSKPPAAVGGSAEVTLLDAAGHRYEGSVEVRDGDVRAATTHAVLEARSYQLLGPGPWLRVIGTPEGAGVLIDGDRVGTVPYRAPIAAGRHTLVVREAGYVQIQQTLEVPDDDSRKLEVQVALEPTPLAAAASVTSEPSTEQPAAVLPRAPMGATDQTHGRDKTWLAAPVAIGMVGVALAVAVSVRIATGPEDCVRPDLENRCVERRSVQTGPTVAGYVLSGLMLSGALTWIVVGLNHDAHAGDTGSVQANIGLGQIGLSGSF